MNLEHLTSHLKLDINHLQWQKQSQHLSDAQVQARFDILAEGYCSLVSGSDLSRVEQLVQRYRRHLLN